MAGAYPNSRFRGYDIIRYALRRAEEKRQEASAGDVSFCDPRDGPLPHDASIGFVTTFDKPPPSPVKNRASQPVHSSRTIVNRARARCPLLLCGA